MSIDERIDQLVKDGKLFYRHPEDPSALKLRSVYASSEVQGFLEGFKGIRKDLLPVGAKAAALFDSFTAYNHVTMGMNPHDKDSQALFARNAAVEVGICDLRVLFPNPQVRIFGVFASRDTFVALTYNRRHLLDFLFAVGRCRKQWDYFFGDLKPVVSENVNDYISPPVTAV